ncbi:MAG TPA: ABC transporter permease [Vicinamibacteria bacterium]|jgi:putative ABC transport system permease protein
MLDGLASDLRIAARGLARRPGFALAALATLGLGIGATSMVFTFVNALLLRPLPLGEHSERIVTLHSTHKSQAEDWEDSNLSYADLQDLRGQTRGLEDVAGYVGRTANTLSFGGESERLRGGSVTPNLFPLLGLQPALGRTFQDADAADFGFEPELVLSYRLFERRFGADPRVLGQTVILNGRALTIIGVMPPGIRFPERDDFWVAYRPSSDPERAPTRARRFVAAFGLLRAGVTLPQVQSEVDVVAAALAEQHPGTNRGWGVRALSFRDSAVDKGARAVVFVLLGAVAAVLLIGCANLANLTLARGVARQRELAVRASLGASRARLARQMLAETALLCAGGGLVGLALGGWFVELAIASWPEELPYWMRLDLDWRGVLFTVLVTAVAALCAGLLPAWRASRPDLASDLRDGARGTAGAASQRLQSLLVVGQVAASLALLVGASLMMRSFLRLQAAPSGFVEESLLTMRFYIAGDAYDVTERRAEFVSQLEERVAALPGVAGVAATSSIPVDDGGAPVRLVIERHPVPRGDEPGAIRITASPRLFETLGAPLVEGRTFTAEEHRSAAADVVIVNRALARRFWPEGAIGQRLALVDGGGVRDDEPVRWLRVVGVAPDLQYEEFGEETAASRLNVFRPYATAPGRSLALLLRARTQAPRAQAEAVRRVFREADPGLAIWDVRTMDEVRSFTTWEQRFFGHLMGAFAAQALLLACLGVYGVLAYAVSQRVHEIGVRLALGAQPLDVVRLVVSRGLLLGLAGAGLGLVLSLAVGRALQGVLYGVAPSEPLALLATAAVLLAVVLAASLLPARRAAAIDPIAALRAE